MSCGELKTALKWKENKEMERENYELQIIQALDTSAQ